MYSLLVWVFLTTSLVEAIAASIFNRKSEIFSSSKLVVRHLLWEEVDGKSTDLELDKGGGWGTALFSCTGINRYSLRKRLSVANILLALLICSIWNENVKFLSLKYLEWFGCLRLHRILMLFLVRYHNLLLHAWCSFRVWWRFCYWYCRIFWGFSPNPVWKAFRRSFYPYYLENWCQVFVYRIL